MEEEIFTLGKFWWLRSGYYTGYCDVITYVGFYGAICSVDVHYKGHYDSVLFACII